MPTSSRGLFRTPLACALLTGAIGGGAAVIASEKGLNPYETPVLGMAASLGCDFLMCCGPALCRRNPKLLFHAAGWAVALALVDLFLPALYYFHFTFFMAVVTPYWLWFFIPASVILGVVIGLAAAGMYKQPLYYTKCVVFGILGQVPVVLVAVAGMTAYSQEDAAHGFITMLFLLSYVTAIAFPAIPIDAAWRKGEIVENLPRGPIR